MASTYESPETVVISEAEPIVAALKGVSDLVSTNIKRVGELRNAEAIANKKRQAELAKTLYIDPEKIFKRLQENKAGNAIQDQALYLLGENTKYSASDSVDANMMKALTVKKLNSLIGYSADAELFKNNWIENAPEMIAGMAQQKGTSALDGKYWAAANIFSGVEEGGVEISYDNNGLMFYNITGEGLEKPYKATAMDFLSRELPKVPAWDDEIKTGLIQQGLIDESTGKLTISAREKSVDEYNKIAENVVVSTAAMFAKGSMSELNSLGVEVFGNENTYMEGRATGEIKKYERNGTEVILNNNEFSRSIIDPKQQTELINSALNYSFNIGGPIPKHYGVKPKPLSTSEINRIKKKSLFEDNVKAFEDKFLRTLGNFEGGFNAANVIKGGLNIFSKDKDGKVQIDKDDNKILNPKFVEALSYLGGYRVVSTPGEKEAVIKGDNGLDNFTVTDGQPINIFIENLHKKLFEGNSLYDANSAGRFAYQSDFINDKSSKDIKAQYKKFQTAGKMD